MKYSNLFIPVLLFAVSITSSCKMADTRQTSLFGSLKNLEQKPAPEVASLKEADILGLSDATQDFIVNSVGGIEDPYEKVRALRRLVFDEEGLNYSVDSKLTLTAEEAFRLKEGNCVALANFFVAATRLLGVDAVFQEVDRETVSDIDKLRIVARHINVSGKLPWKGQEARYVLDYLTVPEEDFNSSRIISDQRAFAHYYNNLGAEFLQKNDLDNALLYLKKALSFDADTDFIWSNLGIVYLRRGEYEAAEFTFHKAMDLNRDNGPAERNMQYLRELQANALTQ
jgi:tetratricopeptide (TPR) repeat protein